MAAKFESTPMCFAIYRSPQQDAEAGCDGCRWDVSCRAAYEHNEKQAASAAALRQIIKATADAMRIPRDLIEGSD